MLPLFSLARFSANSLAGRRKGQSAAVVGYRDIWITTLNRQCSPTLPLLSLVHHSTQSTYPPPHPSETRIGLDNWRVWILDRSSIQQKETPYESHTHYRPGAHTINIWDKVPLPKSFASPTLRGRHDILFRSSVLVVKPPFLLSTYPFGRSLSSTLTIRLLGAAAVAAAVHDVRPGFPIPFGPLCARALLDYILPTAFSSATSRPSLRISRNRSDERQLLPPSWTDSVGGRTTTMFSPFTKNPPARALLRPSKKSNSHGPAVTRRDTALPLRNQE